MIKLSDKIEEELVEHPTSNILVVDALNLAFRWKHMGKLLFCDDYVKTVRSLAKSYECGTVIITADWGNSSFRKEIFPEYKGNREELKKNQTEAEARDFQLFFAEYEKTLQKLEEEFLLLKYKNVEADDLAAFVCKKYSNSHNIWLISSDKDWDLLICDTISRFSTVTRKETTVFNWDEHYDVSPEDYITYKCLVGDSGDNIPGIPGVGPVKAKQLIDTYGTGYDIFAHCPIDSKYKYIQNLNENCKQILVNYELMDLITYCEDAIGQENLLDLEEKLQGYVNEG